MSYRAGQRVRVAARPHEGHHRTPGYVKGKTGTVERAHASFTNPETRATARMGSRSSRCTSSASRSTTSGPTTADTLTTGSTSTSSSTGWRKPNERARPRPSACADHERRRASGRRACSGARGAARREGRDPPRGCRASGSTGSSPVRPPTVRGSSRAPGSTRSSRSACSPTRAPRRSSSVSTRGRRLSSSPSRTRDRASHGRLHALLLLPEGAARPAAGLVQEPPVPLARRLRPARRAHRVRASSSTTTSRCACSTRPPTSATW